MRLPTRFLIVPAIALITGLSLMAAACGGGDDGASAEEIQEVEDIVRQLFEASGADVDFVLDHVTDDLLETAFFTTREECAAAPDDCIGEGEPLSSIANTEIDGDSATTNVVAPFGAFDVHLVREDDVWKGAALLAASDEVPEGTELVDLSLIDFGFSFAEEDIPSGGDFGFSVSNDGAQPHEVIVQKIPADLDLEAAIADDEPPPGVEDIAFKILIVPGQEDITMSLDGPLEAGRYALICFFPDIEDPEMTPHAFKGMLADFTIE